MDVLLSAGEQISMSLLAMAIENKGYPVVSLTGWQAEIRTDSNHGSARIHRIYGERIRKELDKRGLLLLQGFRASINIMTLQL